MNYKLIRINNFNDALFGVDYEKWNADRKLVYDFSKGFSFDFKINSEYLNFLEKEGRIKVFESGRVALGGSSKIGSVSDILIDINNVKKTGEGISLLLSVSSDRYGVVLNSDFSMKNGSRFIIGGTDKLIKTEKVSRMPVLGYIPFIDDLVNDTEVVESKEKFIFVLSVDSGSGETSVDVNEDINKIRKALDDEFK